MLEIALPKCHKKADTLHAGNVLCKRFNLLMVKQVHILGAHLVKIVHPLDAHRRNFYPFAILPVASRGRDLPQINLGIKIGRKCIAVVSAVAEGTESGGHIGENTTMCLVPQVVDALEIPVIAAGGIADGRGIAASFMLGAEGVQIGTRFLAAEECQIHPTFKELVVKAKDTDSVVTGRYTGHPCRNIKTKFSKKLAGGEKDGSLTPEQFEEITLGSLRKAVVDGNVEEGSFLCGAIAGMVNDVKPCAEIIKEMAEQAEKLLKI